MRQRPTLQSQVSPGPEHTEDILKASKRKDKIESKSQHALTGYRLAEVLLGM